jgi:hypothetical protein
VRSAFGCHEIQLFLATLYLCLAAKAQVNSFKKDQEAVKTKYNEVSEKLMEKTRQYQKLQVT